MCVCVCRRRSARGLEEERRGGEGREGQKGKKRKEKGRKRRKKRCAEGEKSVFGKMKVTVFWL